MDEDRASRTRRWLYRAAVYTAFVVLFFVGSQFVLLPLLRTYYPQLDLPIQKMNSVMGGAWFVVFIGLVMWFLAAWLRRYFLRLRQAETDRVALGIMRELRASPAAHVPEFYLYLRAFETTGRLHVPLFLRLRKYSVGLNTVLTDDVESYVSSAIKRVAPLIALGHAGEAIGAGRIATDDDKWQSDIRVLIDRARAILVVPSDRPGTMWEMETLKSGNLLHKVIFVMPPRSKGALDTRQRWDVARQAMVHHGLEPPEYDDRGLFFEVGPDGRICNVEPMVLTSPRQVRKSLKRLLSSGQQMGLLKAAARAERRNRRATFSGWAQTIWLFSPYALAALAIFLPHASTGFNPRESWGTVFSRSASATTLAEYDDSVKLARSEKFQALEAQVPANQRDAWRTDLLLHGLMRVKDEEIRGYTAGFGRMLERVDDKTCASIASGEIRPDEMSIAMTYMPSSDVGWFLGTKTAAMIAEAEGQPLHPVDPAAAAAANEQFLAHLSAEDRQRYQRIDQGKEPLTPDSRCWLLRRLYGGAGELSEAHATVWARSLAADALPATPDPQPATPQPPAPRPTDGPPVRPTPAPAPQPPTAAPAPPPKPKEPAVQPDAKSRHVPANPEPPVSPPPQPQPVVNEPPATPRPAPETSRPSYPRLLDDAVAAVRANRFNEAAEVVDQLIKLDPGRGEGWSLRGLLAMDVYADLPAAREAYENALSRGTAVVFRVVHDHGNQQQFCVGNLRLTGSGVDFTPETGDHRFQASYAAVKEAAFNGVLGSQLAMFHIKADLTGGTKNFNLVAVRSTDQQVVNRKANAELLLRLVNERRAR